MKIEAINFKGFIPPKSEDFLDFPKENAQMTQLSCREELNQIVGDLAEELLPYCKSTVSHWAYFIFFAKNRNKGQRDFFYFRKNLKNVQRIVDANKKKYYSRMKEAHEGFPIAYAGGCCTRISKERLSRKDIGEIEKAWRNQGEDTCKLYSIVAGGTDKEAFKILEELSSSKELGSEMKKLLFSYFACRSLYNRKGEGESRKSLGKEDIKKAAGIALKLKKNLGVSKDLENLLKSAKKTRNAPFEKEVREREKELDGNARVFTTFRLDKFIQISKRFIKDTQR